MDLQEYWDSKHKVYSNAPWQDKPAKFSHFIIDYLPKSGKVLELGAGQGQNSRFFASLGYEVTSTDFNEYALELSRKKALENNLVGINFSKLDMSKMPFPFPDSSFDIVYSHLSIHYFEEETTRKLFTEIARILEPNGIFAFLANSTSDQEIKEFEKIDENYYRDQRGLAKRYFSIDYTKEKANGLFKILFLDNNGESADPKKPKNMIRFIGRKKG